MQVCVHSRDWNVGEGIPSQIFRSVADSRKTIIVLSQVKIDCLDSLQQFPKLIKLLSLQSYVESKWSDMEFMAAHKKALQDKIQVESSSELIENDQPQLHYSFQRVIVIKHGELIAEAEMEEDLQNYLKMNTYLDSADPWFWPKLRFLAE